jgi:hypothetical protein
MTLCDGRAVLGYQDHYLVDGGRARIILHAVVTPGDVVENMVLLDQYHPTVFRRKLPPERIIADAKYASTTNIRALEGEGIPADVPLPEWDKSSHFERAAFIYDPAENLYRCSQGEPLHLRWTDQKGEQWLYQARAAACNACPVKDPCTTSNQGRLIRRSFHEADRERVRTHTDTPAFKRAMRKRSVWDEGLSAAAKQWHGLYRFRLRGLANVNIQALASGYRLGTTQLPERRFRPGWHDGVHCQNSMMHDRGLPGSTAALIPITVTVLRPLFHRAGSLLRRRLAQRKCWEVSDGRIKQAPEPRRFLGGAPGECRRTLLDGSRPGEPASQEAA